MIASTSDIAPSQADAVAFLSSPAAFGGGIAPDRVERIDTHGAHLFLAGGEVLKIKRAVRYSYMDFSTLERRRAACAREVEINRPHAPMIYRGLVAITREAGGALAVGGSGEPVEWAVRMARFPEEQILSNRAARAAMTPDEAKALANAVFRYHAAAASAYGTDFAGAVCAIVADVTAALGGAFASADRAAVDALAARLGTHSAGLGRLLTVRAQAGHVRRCHGDLHLGNIVLIDGAPVLFDALEFDEAMATIDTLYDLAFLLMDLDHRGQRAAANAVLNRYLWLSRDLSDVAALAALPLFLALRAAIRAMVGAQKAALEHTADHAGPRAYLQRALTYLEPSRPILVLVGGLSGSGKTTLAAGLAPHVGRAPGALHLRSDLERKAHFRVGEFDRLPESAYGRDATAAVYATILSKAGTALDAGHSVIADAVHAEAGERKRIEALAESRGARLVTFWLDAPRETLLSRVAGRTGDASDATPQVVERQIAYDLAELEWTRIDASGPPEETLRTALSHLHASTVLP